MVFAIRRGLIIKISLIIVVFIVIGALWLWGIKHEEARARDMQRISDALIIHTAFEKMYQHDRSYAAASDHGCEEAGESIRRCKLRDYYRDINVLKDPGRTDYVVTVVPTEKNYEVTFWLEKNHAGLNKGSHTISPEGIK